MDDEEHAKTYADGYLGCVECEKSHNKDSFCDCGRCFFTQKVKNDEYGTFVYCVCGKGHLWD